MAKRRDPTQEPPENADDPRRHSQGGRTPVEGQSQKQRHRPKDQECRAVGQKLEREPQAACLEISADGSGHRPKDRPASRQEDQPIMVDGSVNPVIGDPIRPSREAHPDHEEEQEVSLGEVVLDNLHCCSSAVTGIRKKAPPLDHWRDGAANITAGPAFA
jgi:hypothetical protein